MVTHSQLEGYCGEVKFRFRDTDTTVYGFVTQHVAGAALIRECFATGFHGKSDGQFGKEHLVALEDLEKAPLYELAEAKQVLQEDGELRADPSRGAVNDAAIREASR
jgi:hypothetical protein